MTEWLRTFKTHPYFASVASGVFGAGIGLGIVYACVFVSIIFIGEMYSTESIATIYAFLAIFLLLGLVDFGVGYRYLVSKWDHSHVVVRVLCSLAIIFVTLEFVSLYFSRNYDLGLNRGTVLIVGYCFWVSNICKCLLDRIQMFFTASIVQALPTLMYFYSYIVSQDGLFITSRDIWYQDAWVFLLVSILLCVYTLLVLSHRRPQKFSSIENTSLYTEFCYFLILIVGFFASRFDRFWFSYTGLNDVASDYFELTEVALRLLVFGGIITRVIIPILAPEKQKIEVVDTKREVIFFFFAIVPAVIMQLIMVRVYAPELALDQVIPVVLLLSSVFIVMSFAQFYFAQLVIAGKIAYILTSQVASLLFYIALLSFDLENLVLLLVVWAMRFYLEAGILRFFCRRVS